MSYFVQVVIANGLRKVFTYLPADSDDHNQTNLTDLPVGIRVKVPFGRSTRVGVVVGYSQHSDLATDQLKPLLAYLDATPLLSEPLWSLGLWACAYYQYPLGDGLLHLLPVKLRQGHDNTLIQDFWQCQPGKDGKAAAHDFGRAYKQQHTWQRLLTLPGVFSATHLQAAGISNADLAPLKVKGLLSQTNPTEQTPTLKLETTPAVLNNEQQAAFVEVEAQAHTFGGYLLDGVTGSGKTEVYLHWIAHCLERGRRALVLVPEIGLINQLLERLQTRFNHSVAALHSGLTNHQRLSLWQLAGLGQIDIVVGTRSAVFTPIPRLGLIIVDEEHDQAYKQQEGFRYHARDLAIKRGQLEQLPVVLGSATPSFESLANADQQRYQHLRLTRRAGQAHQPHYQLIDLRQAELNHGIATPLHDIIHAQLQLGHQVLLMLNRRGFAHALQCQTCGQAVQCPACDMSMTLHKRPARLHCHHCDHRQTILTLCPTCQSSTLAPVGSGTERLEDYLQQSLKDFPIYRIDRDTTQSKGQLQSLLQKIHTGKPCILIGTQMLAKGHHFPHVTVAAIIDADTGLFSTDFRGCEKLAQLIIQTAGRAGREKLPGTAYIQTYQAEHPFMQHLIHQGYDAVARQQLGQRQASGLPPFGYMSMFVVQARQEQHAYQLLIWLRQQLGNLDPAISKQLRHYGPMPGILPKKANYYRVQLQLHHRVRKHLQTICAYLCQQLEAHPAAKRLKWYVDVDPHEL